MSEERAIVLNKIAKYPDTPVAARSWHSFYDIIYLMETDRYWVIEERLHEIEGKDFLAIINAAFGDKAIFNTVVEGECETILAGMRYSIHVCGGRFWNIYRGK